MTPEGETAVKTTQKRPRPVIKPDRGGFKTCTAAHPMLRQALELFAQYLLIARRTVEPGEFPRLHAESSWVV